jgi:hypothetical protein
LLKKITWEMYEVARPGKGKASLKKVAP